MDPVALSRIQFAITSIFHFFLVPLTLGLGYFVAIMETQYVCSGDVTYKRLAKFWGKLFLINFAVGVPTGIVMEFQIGMNWSQYSRFVGDVFGVPLAIEALLAFFLESTFLGVWIFGWDRISKRMHVAAIWLVSIATSLSALWILIANAFMQHPVGYVIANGRAEMVDFAAVVFNPKAWIMFEHTLAAGFATASFFVLGVSAYHLVRKTEEEFFRRSFQLAALFAMLATVLVITGGHVQGMWLLQDQPMKAAASEAIWETENPASFSMVALFDKSGKNETWSLRIPRALSFLYYFQWDGEVKGIHQIESEYQTQYGSGDYIPLVGVIYYSFRVMVGAGFTMLALAGYALYHVIRNRVGPNIRWLGLCVWAIALPYIANTCGWIMTEMGRQPFTVYGLLKTENSVSPNLSTGMVLSSLLGFTLIYIILMVVDVYLLTRSAKAGPSAADVEAVSPA